MKILHTSDWHVGKVLKGQSRAEEHKQVLAQVIEIAQAEQPDLVIVAGDLYDTAAPTPEATRLVTRALTALRRTGADVVAIGGNHDNGQALDALRPWAEAAGITLRGGVRDNPAEHVIDGVTADGERWQLAALPFLSQRYAVRARGDVRADRRRGQPDVRRPPRPGAGPADRGLHRTGPGAPGHRAPDRGRGDHRRRRAGRAHRPRLRRAGHRLPGHRALRGAGPPAPLAAGHRARARCATAAARSRSTSASRRTSPR